MNALGCINILWLKELMDWTYNSANTWLESRDAYRYNWGGLDFFEEHRFINSKNVYLFYEQALFPVFASLSNFQQLVLDALAVAICADNFEIWQSDINHRTTRMYDHEIQLSEQPRLLFQDFYDLLSAGTDHSLSEFVDIPWRRDTKDTLDLYKYC